VQRIQQDEYHKNKAIFISVKTEDLSSNRVILSISFKCQVDTSKEDSSPKLCMHAQHIKSHFTVLTTSGDLHESRYSLL